MLLLIKVNNVSIKAAYNVADHLASSGDFNWQFCQARSREHVEPYDEFIAVLLDDNLYCIELGELMKSIIQQEEDFDIRLIDDGYFRNNFRIL